MTIAFASAPNKRTALSQALYQFSGELPDPYFEYTTLLLPGNGTNGAQNNTFLDGSTNNFTITRNGNTTQGTFSPFSQTGWGNYFDGTGDYLSVANNAAFQFGTGDFCIESWVYLNVLPGAYSDIVNIGTNNAGSYEISIRNDGAITFTTTVTVFTTSANVVTANRWYHVALSRSGTTLTLFVDGAVITTVTSFSTNFNNTATLYIASYNGTQNYVNGYLSNLRLVKGNPVYTGAFTPPTSPLAATQSAGTNISAITGTQTSILTCQSNRLIDNSTNNFTITRNGDTRVVAFSPFNPTSSWSAVTNGGSGYFDGNGDYLTTPNVTALNLYNVTNTVECWVYPLSFSTQFQLYGTDFDGTYYTLFEILATSGYPRYISRDGTAITGSSGITLNQWNHVAFGRSGSTQSIWVNGIRVASGTITTEDQWGTAVITIGRWNTENRGNGYLSSLRVVKGTDVYGVSNTTITVPTAPLTAITNTSLLLNFTNAGIYDATSKNDLETVGNAQISTAQSKWGGSSMYFDGSGDYLVVGNMSTNPILALLAGDFTIEWWYYPLNTSTHGILTNLNDSDGTGSLWILTNGTFSGGSKVQFGYNTGSSGNILFGTGTFTINNWYHVAVCRSGINLRCFINGTQEGSTSTALGSGSITSYNRNLVTGATLSNVSYTAYNLNGYIQDLRITKGYARYTANFTPPTAAFPTR